jgi:hypothetical protein
MSSKKKSPATPTHDLQTLKIGSRVRCTDDGVAGRIVWANAVSVKIRWDDGEQVTWRRDSLATRPIQFVDADAPADASAPTEQPEAAPAESQPSPPAGAETATSGSGPAAAIDALTAPEHTDVSTSAPPTDVAPTTAAKSKPQRKAPQGPKLSKPSALDAAAKVLQEAGTPMTCQEMIAAMAAKGYWSSPVGKTPAATLYSAILREITTKGDTARFAKTERGKFALRPRA